VAVLRGSVFHFKTPIRDLFGTDLKPIAWFSDFSTAFAANVAANVWRAARSSPSG